MHPNNLVMKDSFLTNEGESEYLNIVMDYYTDNLYQVVKKKDLNPSLVKVYIYQILRGLNYLSMLSIAHRDIKPQNILVDRVKHNVIISDFGSAKQLVKSNEYLTQLNQISPIFARVVIVLPN
jgi:serine/threonine protein kinase